MPYKDPQKAREMHRIYQARHMERKGSEARSAYNRAYKRKWKSREGNQTRLIEQKRRFMDKHRDRVNAQARARFHNDPEYRAKILKACEVQKLKRDPEKHREAVRQWREKNRERLRKWHRVNAHKRRAAQGSTTVEQWEARFNFYGQCCAYCGKDLSNSKMEIDHVIAITRGGANWPANLVPACPKCNHTKHHRFWHPHQPGPKHRLPE